MASLNHNFRISERKYFCATSLTRRAKQAAGFGVCPSCRGGNATKRTYALPQTGSLFDHLIGNRKHAGGMVRPMDLAVLRFMTSSNFVGCMTGSSDGFSPLYILPT